MLSNHERRELARLERALREDPEWREPPAMPGRGTWWHRWGLRLLIVAAKQDSPSTDSRPEH